MKVLLSIKESLNEDVVGCLACSFHGNYGVDFNVHYMLLKIFFYNYNKLTIP